MYSGSCLISYCLCHDVKQDIWVRLLKKVIILSGILHAVKDKGMKNASHGLNRLAFFIPLFLFAFTARIHSFSFKRDTLLRGIMILSGTHCTCMCVCSECVMYNKVGQ